ncbi:MAG TPA: glycoside hydrolase family 6 protein [Solirubrobacteraceae bacterium]|nr:glycoside hydrolase family 6 protein [Solirubrobacteraceae bacterium]
MRLLFVRLVCALACATALLATAAAGARAGVANAGLPGARPADPLAGMPWGNYDGSGDEVFPSYRAARGSERGLLGLIALRPRMRWFGVWYKSPESTAAAYIANVTRGDPDALAQMAVFRLDPWEDEACHRLPTASEQAGYRAWIDGFAAGIGSARVALVLQPDLPFARCVPHGSRVPLRDVAYAARTFSALPHTTVYIDAGAGDWPTVAQDVALLRAAGVRYARGFALNATHYDSTENEIRFGVRVARGLAAAGLPGMHFVINTSGNGRGFTYQQYDDPSTFDNARVCATRASRRCVTLGIPPTWRVSSPRWGLSRRARELAARYVDAYLWFGRPWLDNQADPFDLRRALALARSTPF